MEDLMEAQKKFMEELGINVNDLSEKEVEVNTVYMITAILSELGELLEGFNWKPWKKQKIVMRDTERKYLLYEGVDILHFLLEIFILWGFDAKDVKEAYYSKMRENSRRQKEGY